MGVRGLTKFVNNNIPLSIQKWSIDKDEYESIQEIDNSNRPPEVKKPTSKNNNLNIIIDGKSYFHYLGNKLNWFIFDYLSIIEQLQKELHLFLAINNLEKLTFVFDGVSEPFKKQTKLLRKKEAITTTKNFFEKVVSTPISRDQKVKPENKLSPVSFVFMTFIKYLMSAKEIFEKLEIVFPLLEADPYIADLAVQRNGLILSNDSDFYIYNVPGYINLYSLKFPQNDDILEIEYELYTNNMLINYLCLTNETLPIFATLCSNDYVKMDNYPELSKQIMKYKCRHRSTDNIKHYYFKHIVNFVLDMLFHVSRKRNYKYSGRNKQDLIIEELFRRKYKEKDDQLNLDFKNNFLFSINEYNLVNNVNELNINDSIYFNDISDEIIKNYYSRKICKKILSTLIKKEFYCNQYFENTNKACCWNITKKLRKNLYEILFIRNNMDKKPEDNNTPKKYTITEHIRNENDLFINKVNIIIDNNKSFPNSVNEQFNLYLKLFKSHTNSIKQLPFYLIPMAINLRYFLLEKIKKNLFICNEKNDSNCEIVEFYNNNKNCNNDDNNDDSDDDNEDDNGNNNNNNDNNNNDGNVNNDDDDDNNNDKNNNDNNNNDNNGNDDHFTQINDSKSLTKLHCYEFKALLASCVAALTFTYLHKNAYENNKSIINNKKSAYLTIIENIKENNIDCNNLYNVKKRNTTRSLKLKNYQSIINLQKNDKDQFENSIQIFAEFCSILLINSLTIEVLKLNIDTKEFETLFSMFHYLWEESFYSMIYYFKISKDKDITPIFNNLFEIIDDTKENTKNYICYLNSIYFELLNSIVSH